jgi:large subunit ribosomal protein L25
LSEQVKLTAMPRTAAGKGETNRLRREGRVPAIVYGHKVDPTPVSVDARELFHALNGPAGRNALITLDIEGRSTLVVARDLQRHAVRRDVLHLDLLAVDQDQQIDVEIPVHLVDVDDVARDGGYLNQVRMVVPIRVRPTDTPDFLELSVAGMGIGDVKRLADVVAQLPAGAELGDDPDRVIVTINAPAGGGTADEATAEGAAADGAAEPSGDAAA